MYIYIQPFAAGFLACLVSELVFLVGCAVYVTRRKKK